MHGANLCPSVFYASNFILFKHRGLYSLNITVMQKKRSVLNEPWILIISILCALICGLWSKNADTNLQNCYHYTHNKYATQFLNTKEKVKKLLPLTFCVV